MFTPMAGLHVVNTKEKFNINPDARKTEQKPKKEKSTLGLFGRRIRSKMNLGAEAKVDRDIAESDETREDLLPTPVPAVAAVPAAVSKPQPPIPEEPEEFTIVEPTPPPPPNNNLNNTIAFPQRVESIPIPQSDTAPTLNQGFTFPPSRMARRLPGPLTPEAFASRAMTSRFSRYAQHYSELSSSSVESIGTSSASATEIDGSTLEVKPKRDQHSKIDLSPGAKLVLPAIPKLADNPLISCHFNQLAKNPTLKLDINFLKKSIYEHEAEAIEAIYACFRTAFEDGQKLYADLMEVRAERSELKQSVRQGLTQFMAANDVAYQATSENRECRAHIAAMKKEIQRLQAINEDLIARKKSLSSECARTKIDNQALESKLGSLMHSLRLKVNELAETKGELASTRTSLNQAIMHIESLVPAGTVIPGTRENIPNNDDIEYLCGKLQQRTNRLNIVEEELWVLRSKQWQMDRLYQYFRAAFKKIDDLCVELHHEIDQVGLKVTTSGPSGDKINRLSDGQVAEIQTSIVKFGIGALRAYYSSLLEKAVPKPEPMLGAEFLNWIEQTFTELIDNKMAVYTFTDDADNNHAIPNDSGFHGGGALSPASENFGQNHAAYNGESSSQAMPRPVSNTSLIDLDYAFPETNRADSPTLGLGHYRGY